MAVAQDPDLRAAAEALLQEVEPAGPATCPDCGKVFEDTAGMDGAGRLALHQRNAHGEGSQGAAAASRKRPAEKAPPAGRKSAADSVVEAVVGKSVAHMIVMGNYLSIVLPHTGIAIAGVPDPADSRRMIVASRAMMAADSLTAWAKRDARVLEALQTFNNFLEASAAGEVLIGIGAAVAVDVGAVDPHLAIEVGPFVGELAIRPVEGVIGDVIGYVDNLRAQHEAEHGPPPEAGKDSPNGRKRGAGKEVPGGVEGT